MAHRLIARDGRSKILLKDDLTCLRKNIWNSFFASLHSEKHYMMTMIMMMSNSFQFFVSTILSCCFSCICLSGILETVACSHYRAVKYFIESVNTQCPFVAFPCASEEDFTVDSRSFLFVFRTQTVLSRFLFGVYVCMVVSVCVFYKASL